MADFPSLTPETRSFTLGSYAVSRAVTLSGDQVSVRRNNAAIGYQLNLTFVSSSVQDQKTIFDHYAIHNRFQPFDLPSTITSGGGMSFPSGYKWIYADSPEISFTPGNVEISVTLELIAPYNI